MSFIALAIIGGALVIEHGITKAIDRLITAIEHATTAANQQHVDALLATGGQSAETTEGATNEATALPDGSAFAVYSYPLPKGHWLYAPREYEQGAEEPKELAAPILTHAAREQVVSAIRYAVRAATDCGKETNFDPDALVQNAVYALCGPFNKNQPQPQADARDAERVDALYTALEVCSAELFAQCAHQGRAMKYVEQARKALAAEQCARAAIAKATGREDSSQASARNW